MIPTKKKFVTTMHKKPIFLAGSSVDIVPSYLKSGISRRTASHPGNKETTSWLTNIFVRRHLQGDFLRLRSGQVHPCSVVPPAKRDVRDTSLARKQV